MKKVIRSSLTAALALLMSMAAAVGALALEVPTGAVVQNLNGTQQYVKTYTVPADADPETLIEAPFEYEGFTYTYAFMTKAENRIEDTKPHTEVVAVETETDDLADVLAALEPAVEYDDGLYTGTLALDHTTISTEAAGHAAKGCTVSESKTYEELPSNDMAYIPATTVKNGVTLKLASVDWQVQATALVDDVLIPSLYRAVANYSAYALYDAVTGYITTAEYTGTVKRSGVESVTYTLTYVGSETAAETEARLLAGRTQGVSPWLIIAAGVALMLILALAVILLRSRRELSRLRNDHENAAEDADYEEVEDRE